MSTFSTELPPSRKQEELTVDMERLVLGVSNLQNVYVAQAIAVLRALAEAMAQDASKELEKSRQKLFMEILDAQAAASKKFSSIVNTALLEDEAKLSEHVTQVREIAIELHKTLGYCIAELPMPIERASGELAKARDRGAEYRVNALRAGNTLSAEDIAGRLQLTRQGIDKKRTNGELFALSWGSRKLHYPAWQLEPGILGEPLKRVLAPLKEEDPWNIYRFLTTPEALLGDATPLNALREGRVDQVEKAAIAFASRD